MYLWGRILRISPSTATGLGCAIALENAMAFSPTLGPAGAAGAAGASSMRKARPPRLRIWIAGARWRWERNEEGPVVRKAELTESEPRMSKR